LKCLELSTIYFTDFTTKMATYVNGFHVSRRMTGDDGAVVLSTLEIQFDVCMTVHY